MVPQIGPLELIVVLIVALIVLGPKRLPEMGNSLGKGLRGFKDALDGNSGDDDDEIDEAEVVEPELDTTVPEPADEPVPDPEPVLVPTDAPTSDGEKAGPATPAS